MSRSVDLDELSHEPTVEIAQVGSYDEPRLAAVLSVMWHGDLYTSRPARLRQMADALNNAASELEARTGVVR